MHNVVLSPISTDTLIEKIAQRTAEMILEKQPAQIKSSSDAEQLLTVDGLAEFLHLSKATIYSNFSKGLIPGGCKKSKRLYFDKEIIVEWIKSGRKLSTEEIEESAEEYLLNPKKKGL